MMEDTVERNVDGLAENIIAQDEERRAQELVCRSPAAYLSYLTAMLFRISSTLHRSGLIGI